MPGTPSEFPLLHVRKEWDGGGAQTLCARHGGLAQRGPGRPALCKQQKPALDPFLSRRIHVQDKRSRYRQGCRGCGPGPWPGCCCVLSPFVCGITEAWPPLPSLTLPQPPLGFGPWPLLF